MYGQDANIGISFQNSGGEVNTDSIYWLPHVNEGLGLAIEQLMSEAMRGVYDQGDSYVGMKTIDGDLELEAQPIPIGVALKALCGAPTTVQSGSIYAHTFKPRQSDWDTRFANDPFTYHQFLGVGSAQMLSDLNVTNLEISLAAGELLKLKLGIVGGTFSQAAAVAATYPVGKHFTWDTASLSIAGTGKSEIMDATIVVDDSLEAQHTLNGSQYPSRIKRTGLRTIEVSGTIKFDDQVEYQRFLTQTEAAMSFNMAGPTEIQSGYYDVLLIQLPLLRYSELKPGAGGPGQLEVGFTASGKYSVTSATGIQFTLTNTQAAY